MQRVRSHHYDAEDARVVIIIIMTVGDAEDAR